MAVDSRLDDALKEADHRINGAKAALSSNTAQDTHPIRDTTTLNNHPDFVLDPASEAPAYRAFLPNLEVQDECSRFLRQLCPCCFGGTSFGKPLTE